MCELSFLYHPAACACLNSYTVVYNFAVVYPRTTFKIKFGVLLLRLEN